MFVQTNIAPCGSVTQVCASFARHGHISGKAKSKRGVDFWIQLSGGVGAIGCFRLSFGGRLANYLTPVSSKMIQIFRAFCSLTLTTIFFGS
jgi:hypothetical protein